mmetsp:Transcript_12801/g.26428  ORF Transcript_12801/g.26428 Transcript_12801/m.26428 type:complete len:540 (-) Transcript_12801:81-1700(-)
MTMTNDDIVRGRDSEIRSVGQKPSHKSLTSLKSRTAAPTAAPPSSRGILGRVTNGVKSLVMGSDSKLKHEPERNNTLPAVVNTNRDSLRRSTKSGSRKSLSEASDCSARSSKGEECSDTFHLPCPSSPATRPNEASRRSLGSIPNTQKPGSMPSSRDSIRVRPFKVGTIYPIIPDRLYFTVHKNDQMTHREARDHPDLIFFSADYQDRYEPFCADFGPVNLGVMHEFFNFMMDKLTQKRFANKKMVYYIDEDEAVRTNAAFLLASFVMMYQKTSPREAWAPFNAIQPSPWKPFRDATFCPQDYYLSILPCLEGVHKAIKCGWYNPKRFDLQDYHYHDHPQNADMHQVSDKFIAFRGPSQTSTMLAPGFWTFTPKHYLPIFKDKRVKGVVRLNEASTYKKDTFEKGGFKHHDLYFDDCTVPSKEVIDAFMSIAEADDGKLAVHCKAGLGRTGTLIALYFMKHHGFTAEECIGWLRVCRPGSIIGPQQHWLHWAEDRLRKGLPLETDEREAEVAAKKSELLAKQVADGMDRKAAQLAEPRR